ncbi:hypothetical protein PFISCL1PPCAC_3795, partial [Pristionchus fissidentatus]
QPDCAHKCAYREGQSLQANACRPDFACEALTYSRMRLLLCLLVPSLIYSEITFSVEEPSMHPKGAHRHAHHKHRHARDHPGGAAVRDQPTTVPERFSLNCPHMADSDKLDVHIEVTWTLDDTVWLKIRDGEQVVHFNRSTFRKKTHFGKAVVRVELAAGRYLFNYDELTGDFMMEINEVQPLDDFGTWECLVTRRQGSVTSSESTRKAIIAPPGAVERRAAAAAAAAKGAQGGHQQGTTAGYRIPPESQRAGPRARIDYGSDGEDQPQTRTTQKFSAFTRPDSNSVQISRDTVDRRRQTVVFDRSVTKDHRHHSVDYELSMADENDDFHYESAFSKHARAAAMGANGAPTGASIPALLAALTVAAALYRL